jgi:hypothetical protein
VAEQNNVTIKTMANLTVACVIFIPFDKLTKEEDAISEHRFHLPPILPFGPTTLQLLDSEKCEEHC